jgi:cell division protein FtsQ
VARRKKTEPEAAVESRKPGQTLPGIDAFRMLKFAALTLALVAAVFLVAWLLWSGEQFLTGDSRFRIPEDDAPGAPPAIEIAGVRNASLRGIMEVFAQDRGNSLFRLDPAERKARIDELPWVKSATVRRIWPNRVAVEIVERVPVAFIQAPAGITGSMENPVAYRPMLIDEDGEILGIKTQQALALPLLKGVRIQDAREMRRARVRLMARVMHDLAPYRDRIPEIDVSAAPAVNIAYEIQGVTVILYLGDTAWRDRLDYFSRNADSIRHVLKDQAVLDLSMDQRVILKSLPEPPKPEEGDAK